MKYYDRWPKYVSVAERREKAKKHALSLSKKGKKLRPIIIEGRTIAHTFWGKAWCTNLESYSDFSNRLPRGRSYIRNGSVLDVQIEPGKIIAQVMGSSLYTIEISITPLPLDTWKALVRDCSGRIDSLIELLQGKFSKSVMEILTKKEQGLFPKPREISMRCSCPDYAGMCKHLAAVMYGVGALLDTDPEKLFVLRSVNHLDLVANANIEETLSKTTSKLDESDLSSLFGIEIEREQIPTKSKKKLSRPPKKEAQKKKAQPKKKVLKKKASRISKKTVKPEID